MQENKKQKAKPISHEEQFGHLFEPRAIGRTLRTASRDPKELEASGPYMLHMLHQRVLQALDLPHDDDIRARFLQMSMAIRGRQVAILLHQLDIEQGIDGICAAKLEDVRERYAFMKYELRDKMK